MTAAAPESIHVEAKGSFDESIEELPIPEKPIENDDNDNDKKKEAKEKTKAVPIYRLFRFATTFDLIRICLGIILSAGIGAMQPLSIIIFGDILGNISFSIDSPSAMLDSAMPMILIFVYMGTAATVAAYSTNCIWILTGRNQTRRIRAAYVHAILRQDMSWFDKAEEGSLNTRLASDTQLIQDGISQKFGLLITAISTFITGFVVAFVEGWELAVVILATLPLLAGTGGAMGYFMTLFTTKTQDSYADAGAVAEQAFSGIRTIYSFSLQDRFGHRYNKLLKKATATGIKRGIVLGLGFGIFMLVLFCTYGLAFWYGAKLVIDGKIDGATVMVVFFTMIIAAFALLQLPQNVSAVSNAAGAAYKIFATIDRIPEIDVDSEKGIVPDSLKGEIEFRNVEFKYPTRPDVPILKNLSLKVSPGMTVAFVGPSGSGKSTSVQLIQRFYDPLAGQVLLDGRDLKTLNVKWLRDQIGVVSQEPVLFNMTIRQNLLMGVQHEVTPDEIVDACKKANCHMFITQLPNGYDTIVGEHGGMMSGGQKQRIAIARAILKNPAILLLDEATSALDTQSERLVQKALDAASTNRTTIVIAHRLSTIRNADLIVVMQEGDLVEQGTHNTLLALGGVYAELVKKQEIATKEIGHVEQEVDDEQLLLKETIQLKEEKEAAEAIQVVTEKEDGYKLTKTASRSSIDAFQLKLEKKKAEKKLAKKQKAPMGRILKQMRPEWPLLALGVVGAAISGAVFPCFALVLSQVMNLLIVNTADPSRHHLIAPGPMQGANLYSFLFVVLGIVALIGIAVEIISFEVAGERYTGRLRGRLFRTFLKQEIGYFDEEDHSMGALTAKLAVDAKNINEMVTKSWSSFTEIICTAVTGLSIAFAHSWTLTLIILCMAPFEIAAAAYEMKVEGGFEDETQKANEQSGEVAGEAIKEIRTVAALNKQPQFESKYYRALDYPHKLTQRKAFTSSIGYACHQGVTLYTNAVAFYAGVRLMSEGKIDFLQMFTTMMAIMITAQGIGRASAFASTFAKAKFAAISTFAVFDRKPTIDPDMEGIETDKVIGEIEFKDVAFRYPSRPDISIFHGEFNLYGKAGTTIALVGPSGCGKSTTIGMLQRWYDPASGTVRLDDHNVKSFSLDNLRSHMALVSQEPVLFDMSIGENIRFGVEESKNVTQEEVEAACKAANIHKFITQLPDAYDTRVGDKGSQLSGGQKQRIAIARALIRKPKVLLLDEATSALDSESEKLVQAAIDNILEEGGRTTITIAHRLSTIQGADLICVVKNGQVIEQGTHWELLKLNGAYSELVHQQSLNAH
ncbi:P-loop containing nucleoside triphosphate hydrolase protein [Radiomyces spectabilis]|uniref:P-loop containing nucleoside triphosphate hydrolase protein n=1 Tax=Radiomyces spectabilis TaxID=64574 RepID=UPI002220BB29|nr:P-loop containing nucleoside triphosphate hydrolase protein [Radiomyces spectabilis]KAI8391124.1 P-loop containing nucleoside triphosphate hydrolase protein [Radiomyces spectabilis]